MSEPVEPPQNEPPSEKERTAIITSRLPGGSWGGETRFALDGPFQGPPPEGVLPIAFVKHYDDPTLPRPAALIVLWLGAADPDNKTPMDFRYPSNDFDDF